MIAKRVIIHHSLTKDSQTVAWGAIRKWHMGLIGQSDPNKPDYNHYIKKPLKNCAYHFGIELIGDYYEILLGRMMNREGAHTKGQNHDSIGIMLAGNFDLNEPPPEQWNKGLELVHWLCSVFNITYHEIYGHRDFASYKTCPGTKFNVEGFKLQLTAMDLGESISIPKNLNFL